MESATNLNAVLTGWLSRVLSGRTMALQQSARRFAALVSTGSELEVAQPEATVSSAAPVILQISSGLHSGASLRLTANRYLIGRGDDCDIVLRDSHIAEHHCSLIRGWAGFSVRDLHSEVSQLVTPADIKYDGGAIELNYEVGSLQFTVCQAPPNGLPAEPGQGDDRSVSRAVLLVLLVGVLLAAVAVASVGQVGKPGAATRAHQPDARNSRPSEQSAARLMEQARLALADDNLKVEMHDGRLLVEGSTAQTVLKARIQALAADLRGTIPVEDRVTYVAEEGGSNAPGPLPIRVQSVMVGNPGYFITDTGARYFVGGVLPDGAEVSSISAGEIRFARAGQTIVYKLQ